MNHADTLATAIGRHRPDHVVQVFWLAGIVPGLLMAGVFIAWSMVTTRISHKHIAREPRASLREASTAIRKALWALSLPVFVLAYILIITFSIELDWLPVQGYRPINEGLWEWFRHLILPSLALGTVYDFAELGVTLRAGFPITIASSAS